MLSTKINWKCITHWNVNGKTKFLEENVGENLYDLGFCDDILDIMENTTERQKL